MDVNFPEFKIGDDPRKALADFIIQTRNFLDKLIDTSKDPHGKDLFHSELLLDMKAAWRDAYAMFEPIAERASELHTEAIQDHGLYGAQLKFKLSVIRFLYNRYINVGKSTLRGLIGAIDTLLGSILGALHVGEGIKEIKEYIEHSLSD